jgi:thioesterase domain-containing protein/acyl carrier protein
MPSAHFKESLEQEAVACKLLHTSHAFHSAMMDPVVDTFIEAVSKAQRHPPKIPFISTVSARWISDQEATDPGYWGRHLRMPVRFSHGVRELLKKEGLVFVEVGPRTTCATLTRQHVTPPVKVPVTATLAETHADHAEWTALLAGLGYLWLHGVSIDWQNFYSGENRLRIPLPTYPFERKRYWVDPVERAVAIEPSVPARHYDDLDLKPAGSPDLQVPQGQEDSLTRHIVRCIEETSGFSLNGVKPAVTFLELGMDSLLLSQLAYKIKSDFGVKIVFSQLMQKLSTVPRLVEHIRQQIPPGAEREAEAEKPPLLSPPQMPAGPTTVLTVPQKGLWLSSKFGAELSCAYNESITLHLTGDVEVSLLEKALSALVQRHDALRATFSPDGNTMLISPEAAIDLRRIDLNAMDEAHARAECAAILHRDAATAFDLEHGPLFRCHILRMPGKQFHVVLTSHHIVCDGWSLDVLISDLCRFYTILFRKKELRFERSYTFAEFAQWVSRRQEGKEYAAARSYWLNRYKTLFPVLCLPADNPQHRMGAYEAQRIELDISGEVVAALREVCRRKGWSVFTALVAAYNLLLHRITGQRDFVIGLPTAEQPSIGEDNLVGHCVNLLPFWCSLGNASTYEAYVDAVQKTLFEGYDHQLYTFIDLLNEKGIPYDRTGSSTLPAGLTHVKKYAENDLQVDNAKVEYFANPRAYESFELYLNVVESAAAFELKCHFKKAIFSPDTVRAWLELYRETLTKITNAPAADIDRPISQQRDRLMGSPTARPASGYSSKMVPTLLRVWQRVFGNPAIGPQDNFFDIGGHSLLAARLFAEIEKEFGKALPLSCLLHAPTVAQMARLLEEEGSGSDWKPLVPINASGTRPPIFLIHGAEGNILMYRDLAKHLGADQPVFGIQSKGLDNKTAINGNFEEVAGDYLEAIKRQQPQGPYFIGGYCLGGTLALEIAQQLMRKGDAIGLLFMIENYNIKTIKWPLPYHLRMANGFLNVWYHVANLFASQNNEKFAFFKTKLHTEMSRIKISMLVSFSSLMKALGVRNGLDFPHVRVDRVYDEALTRYQPKEFNGKIVLVGAQRQLAGFKDPLYGWAGIARQAIDLFTLPIKPRGSLVEPYVRILAQTLRNCVDQKIGLP